MCYIISTGCLWAAYVVSTEQKTIIFGIDFIIISACFVKCSFSECAWIYNTENVNECLKLIHRKVDTVYR